MLLALAGTDPPPPTQGLPVSLFALLSPGFTPSCPCDTNTCDFTSLCTVKQIPPTATPTGVLKELSAWGWGHPHQQCKKSLLTKELQALCFCYLRGEKKKDNSVHRSQLAGCLLRNTCRPDTGQVEGFPSATSVSVFRFKHVAGRFLKTGSSHSFPVRGSKPELQSIILFWQWPNTGARPSGHWAKHLIHSVLKDYCRTFARPG